MRRGHPILFALLFLLLLGNTLAPSAWPASRAWLIDEDGGATKLDLVQNAIVQTTALGVDRILSKEIAVDPVRGNLFVPNGRYSKRVAVFDLKTLKRKGWLDFELGDGSPLSTLSQLIFPPTGAVFFAQRWNETADGGNGALELVTIDARTLKTTTRRTTSPPLSDQLMLDAAGQTLYSMTGQKPAHIDVFDLPAFTRTSSIDLEAFVDPGVFGRSIHDFGQGKLLFVENIKALRTDPNRFSLFVFDLASSRITPKIQTGLRGEARLLLRTNRVLFNEITDLTLGKDMVMPGVDFVYPGRIHVYDVSTGNRVATVAVSEVQFGKLLAVNLAEDRCYYFSQDASTQRRKLSVIDLRSYAVVKELPLSRSDIRMILFDE